MNKYSYVKVIQQHYPNYGWEDVSTYCEEELRADPRCASNDLKEYRIAQPETPCRLINRRVLNDGRKHGN